MKHGPGDELSFIIRKNYTRKTHSAENRKASAIFSAYMYFNRTASTHREHRSTKESIYPCYRTEGGCISQTKSIELFLNGRDASLFGWIGACRTRPLSPIFWHTWHNGIQSHLLQCQTNNTAIGYGPISSLCRSAQQIWNRCLSVILVFCILWKPLAV